MGEAKEVDFSLVAFYLTKNVDALILNWIKMKI